MQRRLFMQRGVAAVSLVAVQSGLMFPRRLLAAWPDEVFAYRQYGAALDHVTGGATVLPSTAISVEVPDLIEDGRLVEVAVSTTIKGAEEIIIFSEKNPLPLIARFILTAQSFPTIKTRIKMGGSGNVVAVVRAEGAYHSAKKHANVTAGGCA